MYQSGSLCISGDILWAYCILKIITKKIAWYQMQHAYCILHSGTSIFVVKPQLWLHTLASYSMLQDVSLLLQW